MQCGLPGWRKLIDQIILAWKLGDTSSAANLLSDEQYIQLIRHTFRDDDLAIAGFLRRRIEGAPRDDSQTGLRSFSELLYAAVYADATGTGQLFVPQPNHVHRHLIALFAAPSSKYPRRIWTTNYDDLLEKAAREAGISFQTLDRSHRIANGDLAVAHLHGFLPSPDVEQPGDSGLREAEVILSEDDYHKSTADVIGWTNRELYRVFDEHRVLLLGMSLEDPNVRRVLTMTWDGPATSGPRHFAVLRTLALTSRDVPNIPRNDLGTCREDVNTFRCWDWDQHGVEVIELPDYDSILPFLVRVRYESFGDRPLDLWRAGGRRGYGSIMCWDASCQNFARRFLAEAVHSLQTEFSLTDPSEIVEIGVFLLRDDDSQTLELTFRSRDVAHHGPGKRTFSADPDHPTGVAGRVFVSGDLVRISRRHPLHDYGLGSAKIRSLAQYNGIISVPIIDWEDGGVPMGVIYLTTSRTDGPLFRLDPANVAGPDRRSLNDLYQWLSNCATTLLGRCRGIAGTAL